MADFRRILIIKLSSIGDVVHTLPAVHNLKRALPSVEVDWLVENKSKVLLEGNSAVSKVIDVDTHRWRQERGFASLSEMKSVFSKLRDRQYDFALDFQGLWKSAAFGYFSGARRLIGFDRQHLKEPGCRILYDVRVVPRSGAVHVIDLNKELLRGLDIVPGDTHFELPNRSEDREYIEQQLKSQSVRDFVVINPGGGWSTKNWDPQNYATLHQRLTNATGLKSVLTWGPGELPLIDEIRRCSSAESPVVFPTTLTQFVALARRARLFIGGDTGPLHIAAACKTPIVGIYGPTDPARNGPFHQDDIVVSHQVPCGPCYKRSCEIYKTECLRLVTVDEVFKAALRRLSSEPTTPATEVP